jgi:hypothetical protein
MAFVRQLPDQLAVFQGASYDNLNDLAQQHRPEAADVSHGFDKKAAWL